MTSTAGPDASKHGPEQVGKPGTPAGRDVVVEQDDVVRADGGEAVPARAAAHGGRVLMTADRVGQDDVVRVRLEYELGRQLRVAGGGRGAFRAVSDALHAEQAKHPA